MKKKLMQVLICLSLICLNASVALAGNWITDSNGGKIWNPNPVSGESITWSGAYDSNGRATGWGVLQWYRNGIPGEQYEGEMQDGQPNGTGKEVYTNGDYYEGEFKNYLHNGTGKRVYADGGTFDGTWVDGKRTYGVITMPNGEFYSGEFSYNDAAYPWLIRSPIPKEIGDFVRRSYHLSGLFGGTFTAEGYVEDVSGNKIKIRITSNSDFYAGDTHLCWNAVIWDDYNDWHYTRYW